MDENNQQVDPAILRLTRFKGRQLAGRYGFARHDAEDIQQDLVLEYLQRSRSFDSHRCSRRTFGERVINNRIATLIEAQKAACRDYRLCGISLDQFPDHQDGPNSAPLDNILFSVAKPCGPQSAEGQLNLRLDVERILIGMPAALVSVCRLVMVCDSAMDVMARAGISRATLYRRLGQVRAAFVEAGFGGLETIARTKVAAP